jgi:hypothetical protein
VKDDVADLRHFAMDAGVGHVAESVGADDRAGVNAHALADLGLIVNDDVGKKPRLGADDGITPDMIAALQHDAGADF